MRTSTASRSRSDFADDDGTHPSQSGEQKTAFMILSFLKREPTARDWFLSESADRHRAVRH